MSDAKSSDESNEVDPPRIRASVLFPLVYGELRRLAATKMQHENSDHTLDATGLVHEAFLKLGSERFFSNEQDFLQAAAQAMRRILIDHARGRNAIKRSRGKQVQLLEEPQAKDPDQTLEALDEALNKLEKSHPELVKLVELRRFAGLPLEKCANVLGVSARTIDRWWTYARAWLAVELSD
jgi:RNA polymerase sigma factor (TIGR02999 family)